MASCVASLALWVFLVMLFTQLLGGSGHSEELDPYDMVNFDHVNMKMKKNTADDSNTQPVPVKTNSAVEDFLVKAAPETISVTADQKANRTVAMSDGQRSEGKEEEDALRGEKSKGQSCPALFLFQQFVSRLLWLAGHKFEKIDEDNLGQFYIRFALNLEQWNQLDGFRRDCSGDRVHRVHEVLMQAVESVHTLQESDSLLQTLWQEDHFGLTRENVLQLTAFLVLIVFLLVLLSKFRFSWALVAWTLFLTFVISVATTWYTLYKKEAVKQHQALVKEQPSGCNQPPDSLLSLLSFYFTFQKDTCTEYYEDLLIHPIVKVSILEAVAVAVVQTALKPMQTVGTAVSELLRALIKDLPVQWQLFSVVSVFSTFILLLFLLCGYQIRVLGLLTVGPSHHTDNRSEVKALKNKINELQAIIQTAAYQLTARSGPGPAAISETLGVLSASDNTEMTTRKRPRCAFALPEMATFRGAEREMVLGQVSDVANIGAISGPNSRDTDNGQVEVEEVGSGCCYGSESDSPARQLCTQILLFPVQETNSDITLQTVSSASNDITLQAVSSASNDITLQAVSSASNDVTLQAVSSASNDITLQAVSRASNDITLQAVSSASNDVTLLAVSSASNDVTLQAVSSASNDVTLQAVSSASNDITLQAVSSASNDVTLQAVSSASNDVTLQAVYNDITLQAVSSASNDVTLQAVSSASNDITLQAVSSASNDVTLQAVSSASNDVTLQAVYSASNDITLQAVSSASNDITLQTVSSASNDVTLQAVSSANNDVTLQTVSSASNDVTLQAVSSANNDVTLQAVSSASNDVTLQAVSSASNDTTLQAVSSASNDVTLQAVSRCSSCMRW